ncbi:MAG: hypothetical protein WBF17_24715 [Phycisphaerae bacterium]
MIENLTNWKNYLNYCSKTNYYSNLISLKKNYYSISLTMNYYLIYLKTNYLMTYCYYYWTDSNSKMSY